MVIQKDPINLGVTNKLGVTLAKVLIDYVQLN